MAVQVLTTVSSTSTGGGRDGHVTSDTGRVDLDLRPQKELGGSGEGSNPEELFSAGYAACFMGALRLVAKDVVSDDTTVTVSVGIGKDDVDGGFGLTADITVHLPGADQDKADAAAQAAHGVCPYSKATRGNIAQTVTATT